MKKMPTLFERIFDDKGKISEISKTVAHDCEWVMKGEGVATQKLDGTCCMVLDGTMYARYDAKRGKKAPENAIPCQPDPDYITGHWPHWIPAIGPNYKWHQAAFQRQSPLANGTYELCGEHFMNDPEKVGPDTLIRHGSILLFGVDRTFEGIRDYLQTHDIEGIVFHRKNGDMCKIKGSDFGFKRQLKHD